MASFVSYCCGIVLSKTLVEGCSKVQEELRRRTYWRGEEIWVQCRQVNSRGCGIIEESAHVGRRWSSVWRLSTRRRVKVESLALTPIYLCKGCGLGKAIDFRSLNLKTIIIL